LNSRRRGLEPRGRQPSRIATMIAIIKHVYEQIADAAKFAAAVWHDARSLQADAEKKYGYIGF
jgi:hypothetical protein